MKLLVFLKKHRQFILDTKRLYICSKCMLQVQLVLNNICIVCLWMQAQLFLSQNAIFIYFVIHCLILTIVFSYKHLLNYLFIYLFLLFFLIFLYSSFFYFIFFVCVLSTYLFSLRQHAYSNILKILQPKNGKISR